MNEFAGEEPRPRPTSTVITPNYDLTVQIVMALLSGEETFTVEPSLTQEGAWHLGLFERGKQIAINILRFG